MNVLGQAINKLFDGLMIPVAGWPAVAMVLVSVITAVWALLLFKAVTPQGKLTATRDRLMGHIYEMGLYQDHLSILAKVQGSLAMANLRYLSLTLPALVVLTIPMVLTLGQLDSRYNHRPFEVGETSVFTVTVARDADLDVAAISLSLPEGVVAEAGPVRNAASGTVAWRLRADSEGTHALRVLADGQEIAVRDLRAGDGLVRLNEINRRGALAVVMSPGARPLAADSGLARMSLQLPSRHTAYLGLEMNWLVAFCVFSLIVGLAMKDLFKVSM